MSGTRDPSLAIPARRPTAVLLPVLLLLLVTGTAGAVAQESTGDDSTDVARSARTLSTDARGPDMAGPREFGATHRLEEASPEIDGRLEAAVWGDVAFEAGFTQREPDEGAPSTQRTEVAVLYDEDNLYIGARLYRENPEDMQAHLARRDEGGNAERLIVSLDTFLDRRTAYSFAVTAAGSRMDYYHPSDRSRSRDRSWDPVWEAAAHIDSTGWTAEMRIPFSQLRFDESGLTTWGLQINRWMPGRNEDVFWVHIPRTESGWASNFGTLELEGIRSDRPLEALPYVATQSALRGGVDRADPFVESPELGVRAGADFKLGLGANLTLDATVNPDFGQVEPDPAEVNLSAFETFFPERRPFFTEGSQLLGGRGPQYFRSRRIGAAPRGDADGDFVDRPENTTILGAGKLTGRLGSGLSVGALAAITDREHAITRDTAAGVDEHVRVEPRTGFGVVRLQQEFGEEASTAGLSLTGVDRATSPGEPLANTLARRAFAGGVDWNFRFEDATYEMSGHVGGSHIRGEPAAMLEAQRSSARYFQRPGAGHVTLDSTRTALSGYAAALQLEKQAGEHWLWEIGGSATSPGFEINDAGRLREADRIEANAELEYRETEPGSVFRTWSVQANLFNDWNFGGVRTQTHGSVRGEVEWLNFIQADLDVDLNTRAQSDRLTRGGPLMRSPAGWGVSLGVSNSFAAATQWDGDVSYSADELGSWRWGISGGLAFRPSSRTEISIDPSLSRRVDARQYVTTLEDGGPSATLGRRYIFAFIRRAEVSTRLRLDYTFTPDLSLELFAEPFAASGRFYDYGELAAPRTSELRTYGTDGTTVERRDDGSRLVTDGPDSFTLENDDFRTFSFRSTAVLRWQWRPGSTFFLVWQQDRSRSVPRGDAVGPGSLRSALSAEGDHVLTAKLRYWLPI